MTRKLALAGAPALLAALAFTMPAPLTAHGKVSCNGGDKAAWKNVEELKAKLVKEGWKISKAKPWNDCYEVYGVMSDGKKVEAFFHPVTFATVQILQRGKMIFPAS